MTTPTDKDLAQLLQPLQESLAGINRSLRTLADTRLLEIFGPELSDRKKWTEQLKHRTKRMTRRCLICVRPANRADTQADMTNGSKTTARKKPRSWQHPW